VADCCIGAWHWEGKKKMPRLYTTMEMMTTRNEDLLSTCVTNERGKAESDLIAAF